MVTREELLGEAVRLAGTWGFTGVTRAVVAKSMDVSGGCVTYHFKNMNLLRTAMVRDAINHEAPLRLLGQAIAQGHWLALNAPAALRVRAVNALADPPK